MKKKFLLLALVALFSTSLFAYEGMMTGEENVRVVSTEWFDIIYPESCEISASLLFENADSIYKEISTAYNFNIPYRLPVTIVSGVEPFNAYFSTGYYNHIVLYDTYPIDEMVVFKDDFLSTFRHELTHAFTMNMKSPFWRAMGSVFGDPASPVFIFVTGGMAEGATLTSESSFGEGRLNDEFAKQMVRQAKIEKKFPSYDDMCSAREIYPYGSYYFFNGAFHQWLQTWYGMEKYAEWWYRTDNAKNLTQYRAFRKIYGMDIEIAWERFYKTIEVPVLTESWASDFFSDPIFNRKGALYADLCNTDRGVFYMDSASGDVSLYNGRIHKKLFTFNNLDGISASSDGKFIALEHWSQSEATTKAAVTVYSTEKNKFYQVKGTGFKNVSIIRAGSDYYLIGVKWHGQDRKLTGYKLKFVKNTMETELAFESDLLLNEYIDDITDIGGGIYAFMDKTGTDKLQWKLCFGDMSGNINKCIDLDTMGEGFRMKDLSYNNDDNSLYFTWIQKGTMPRLGTYNLSSQVFSFNNTDVSGGIYNPVVFGGNVIYLGYFFEENRAFVMANDLTDNTVIAMAPKLFDKTAYVTEKNNQTRKLEKSIATMNTESDKFKLSKYYLKGLNLPLANVGLVGITDNYTGVFGITHIAGTPWDSGVLTVSALLDPFSDDIHDEMVAKNGVGIAYSSGTDTSRFRYNLASNVLFAGFKELFQVNAQADFSTLIPITNKWRASLSSTSLFAYEPNRISNILLGQESLGANLSYYVNTGSSRNDYFVVSPYVSGVVQYLEQISYADNLISSVVPGVSLHLPKLLPLENVNRFTYNLPFTADFNMFSFEISGVDSYGNLRCQYNLFNLSTDVKLFEYEIQKSKYTFFWNTISLSSGFLWNAYKFESLNGNIMAPLIADAGSMIKDYVNNSPAFHNAYEVYLQTNLSFMFFNASPLKVDVYARLSYGLHSGKIYFTTPLGTDALNATVGITIK